MALTETLQTENAETLTETLQTENAETLTEKIGAVSLEYFKNYPAIEIHSDREAPYYDYWGNVAKMLGPEARFVAKRNQRNEQALTERLYDPTTPTGNRYVDNLAVGRIAKEWYLKLGSLNWLNGSSSALMLAASLLWENPSEPQTIEPNHANRFFSEVENIGRHGQIPENMQLALTDEDKLANITLSGQALLDIARIPKSKLEDRVYAAELSYKVNLGLTEMLSKQTRLTLQQKRVLSDALKAKYDARFELLSLRKDIDNRESNVKKSNDEKYEKDFNNLLLEQVQAIFRANEKLTNGDLHENYLIALMRYSLNTWQEQNRYEVRTATRRQDAPNDGFALEHLPRFSIDALVSDKTGEKSDRLIQIKTNQRFDEIPYADGIILLDTVLLPNLSNSDTHKEIETGLRQMIGLLREITTGDIYRGDSHVISRHVSKMRQELDL